jgi:hypothetical protein
VVAIALNGSRTAILIGNGDGTFRPPLIITEPNLNIPHQQAVADFNGDGFQDLALSLADGNTGLMEILNGNGDGTFQPRVLYLPPPPTSVGGYAIVAAQATASAPALSAIALSPTSVVGGASSQGTATLTSAAPAGGFAVSLSSSAAAASVPASVSVAQGATSATFPISTSAVTTSTPVTITASAGGITRTATLTVAPPAQTATLTVTATGRTGERVTSSPAGINVTVGSSGSASFATGTTITLSATNGRDVVWSGACSSAGNKTMTCTFTLAGTATVTANVQ